MDAHFKYMHREYFMILIEIVHSNSLFLLHEHPLYSHLLILTPYPPPLFNTFHFPDILLLPKFLQAIFTGIALYIIFFKFMLHFVAFPVFLFFFLFQFDLFCTTTLSQNKSMDPLKTCVCANPIYTWFIQCCSQYCVKDDN